MSQNLYNFLVEKGDYTKSYEDFVLQFSTSSSQDSLYNFMSQKGDYTKNNNDFKNQFFNQSTDVKTETKEVKGLSGSFYENPTTAEQVQESLFNIKDNTSGDEEIISQRATKKYFSKVDGFDKWLEDNNKQTLKKIYVPKDKSYRYEGQPLTKSEKETYLKEYLGEQLYNDYKAWKDKKKNSKSI